jgi:hypothetical protein
VELYLHSPSTPSWHGAQLGGAQGQLYFKWDEVVRGWRRLHNEELHKIYASPNIIRVIKSGRMRGVGHIARFEQVRNAYSILVGKAEGKRTF